MDTQKKYRVTLNGNHNTGHYRRGGHEFHTRIDPHVVSVPVYLSETEMTPELRNDPMLVVEELSFDEQQALRKYEGARTR